MARAVSDKSWTSNQQPQKNRKISVSTVTVQYGRVPYDPQIHRSGIYKDLLCEAQSQMPVSSTREPTNSEIMCLLGQMIKIKNGTEDPSVLENDIWLCSLHNWSKTFRQIFPRAKHKYGWTSRVLPRSLQYYWKLYHSDENPHIIWSRNFYTDISKTCLASVSSPYIGCARTEEDYKQSIQRDCNRKKNTICFSEGFPRKSRFHISSTRCGDGVFFPAKPCVQWCDH